MKYKYLILDFGDVLFHPKTDNWFITQKFLELVDISKIDKERVLQAIDKYGYILSKKMVTLEEEYYSFYEFYKNILIYVNYPVDDELIKKLSYDFTYNFDKYEIYPDVIDMLAKLSNDYTLILLSDNWPCGEAILKHYDIAKYFKKIYISSVYNSLKMEGVFFDYPIKEFNIGKNEALFIDDKETILDVAKSKGLDVKIMMRNDITESKYDIVNNLEDLEVKKWQRLKILQN